MCFLAIFFIIGVFHIANKFGVGWKGGIGMNLFATVSQVNVIERESEGEIEWNRV